MQSFVEIPLLRVAYEVAGPVDGFPVILNHGWPDDVRTWDLVLPPLHLAGYRTYVPWLRGNDGGSAGWLPNPDLHAPPPDTKEQLVDKIAVRLEHGEHVLIHCADGLGRAGTTAVAVLLRFDQPLDASLAHVRACRPLAGPEAGTQIDLVIELAQRRRDAQGIR